MEERLQGRDDISYEVRKRNAQGLPVSYTVHYRMLSICGVEEEERLNEPGIQNFPKFAGEFVLIIDIPAGFPAVDAMPVYSFRQQGRTMKIYLILGTLTSVITVLLPGESV